MRKNKHLTNKVHSLLEENQQLQSKIQDLNSDVPNSHYLSQIEEQKSQIDSLVENTKAIKKRAKEDINNLRQKVIDLENERDQNQAKIQSLERQNQKIRDKLKSTQEKFLENQSLKETHQEYYKKFTDELQDKNFAIKHLECNIDRMNKNYILAKQEFSEAKQHYEKEIEDLQNKLKVKQKKIIELDESISKYKNLMEKNKSNIIRYNVEHNCKTTENERKYCELMQTNRSLIEL